MDAIRAEGLTLNYEARVVIESLDLVAPAGKITALVGPNGCGKSTLLRGLARLLKPKGGVVLLEGKAIHTWPAKELAKQLGILPQGPVAPEGLLVRDLVAQGRYPYQSWFQQWSDDDERAVQKALALTGLEAVASRPVDMLSGGQRQRAWIAMTLAQETRILLLDEPTTYLDVAHQIEVLDLLTELNESEGRTIVMVVHDMNHAAQCAHYVVALRAGQVVMAGTPEEVITERMIRDVFGVESHVMPHPVTGVPLCLPLGRVAAAR